MVALAKERLSPVRLRCSNFPEATRLILWSCPTFPVKPKQGAVHHSCWDVHSNVSYQRFKRNVQENPYYTRRVLRWSRGRVKDQWWGSIHQNHLLACNENRSILPWMSNTPLRNCGLAWNIVQTNPKRRSHIWMQRGPWESGRFIQVWYLQLIIRTAKTLLTTSSFNTHSSC